jgi:pimeloyl-ACP methyl ester carboxylesterase
MQQDAALAWQYLTNSRQLIPSQIVLCGTGVGAALATQLAAQHAQVPALIVRSPRPDLLALVRIDPRTRLLPVRLLFHNRFEIAATLATLPTPKLLIGSERARPADGSLQPAKESGSSTGGSRRQSDPNPAALYRDAADPKFTLYVPANSSDNTSMLSASFTRFFDQYLLASPTTNPDTKPDIAPPLPTSR